jgi:hypothetical protein
VCCIRSVLLSRSGSRTYIGRRVCLIQVWKEIYTNKLVDRGTCPKETIIQFSVTAADRVTASIHTMVGVFN